MSHVETVVLKVAQNCNLDCTYCYVYNRGDESWRERPALIGLSVLNRLGERIREHCAQFALDRFTLELHGGEPLLLGKRRMRVALAILRDRAAPARIRFIMQTNGLLLDEEWLEIFDEYDLSFGVSLDGPAEYADRRRVVRKTGAGSTEAVLGRLRYLREKAPPFGRLFGGCLCVVAPELHGGDIVRWFVDQGIDAFDFLLPDGHRANLPQNWKGAGEYGRFLLEAFETWLAMGAAAPRVRKFEQMMMGMMRERTRLDSLGGDLRKLCVVESDGSIGVSDVARICGGVYSKDELNIFDHPLDAHATGYQIAHVQEPSATCRGCGHFDSCGGGYLPHRFDGRGFDNPSIYCEALWALADKIEGVVAQSLKGLVARTKYLEAAPDEYAV